MSIHFITGKPGNGKGLVAMREIINELVDGERTIITNLPVHIEPWVRIMSKKGKRKFQPEIGLRHYLVKHHGKDFDVDKRLAVLPDDLVPEFYRYRLVDGKLQCADVTERDKKNAIVSYDTKLAMSSGGCLYIVDEAWKFYGSRDWQSTGQGVLFYAAQHRKFGDTFLIVTQNSKQVDTAFRQIAQDFWLITNHSKRKVGMFRQPDMFTKKVFADVPTGKNDDPMSTTPFRLDAKGIGACYDTAAGVGLAGGGAADINEKKKGLPWYFVFVGLALGALTVIGCARGAGWLTGNLLSGGFNKSAGTSTNTVHASNTNGRPGNILGLEIRRQHAVTTNGVTPVKPPSVFLVGLTRVGSARAFLSDGNVIPEEKLDAVYVNGVQVGTNFFAWKDDRMDTEGRGRPVGARLFPGPSLHWFQ